MFVSVAAISASIDCAVAFLPFRSKPVLKTVGRVILVNIPSFFSSVLILAVALSIVRLSLTSKLSRLGATAPISINLPPLVLGLSATIPRAFRSSITSKTCFLFNVGISFFALANILVTFTALSARIC